MKKYIIGLSLIATVLAGCQNAIDIVQPGILDAGAAFESVADLEQGLFGVYAEFDNTQAIQFNAAFTDEITPGFDNGGQQNLFILNPQSAFPQAIWVNYYDALNLATRLIEAAALVEVEDGEEADFNNVLGQAYALRAWAHFELLTYFSPNLTDNSAPGVIILNTVPGISDELPRNTTGEVFDAIATDLGQAEDLVETAASATFVSQDFIKALRARIAAYRGDYATADRLAAELLDDYALATVAEYPGIWADTSNAEVIFKLERVIGGPYDGQGATGSGFAGGWAGANFAFVDATVDGSPYFEATIDYLDIIPEEDVRFSSFFDESSGGDTLVIAKYPGSGGQPLLNDLKIFRASEMLMIRAEAAADGNDLAAAAGFVDQLRDARFGADQEAPVYANQQEAFMGILSERRIEFAFEGFRWVDLKRLGTRAGMTVLERNSTECQVNGACSIELSRIEMQAVPIPILELNANTVIQQTEGY